MEGPIPADLQTIQYFQNGFGGLSTFQEGKKVSSQPVLQSVQSVYDSQHQRVNSNIPINQTSIPTDDPNEQLIDWSPDDFQIPSLPPREGNQNQHEWVFGTCSAMYGMINDLPNHTVNNGGATVDCGPTDMVENQVLLGENIGIAAGGGQNTTGTEGAQVYPTGEHTYQQQIVNSVHEEKPKCEKEVKDVFEQCKDLLGFGTQDNNTFEQILNEDGSQAVCNTISHEQGYLGNNVSSSWSQPSTSNTAEYTIHVEAGSSNIMMEDLSTKVLGYQLPPDDGVKDGFPSQNHLGGYGPYIDAQASVGALVENHSMDQSSFAILSNYIVNSNTTENLLQSNISNNQNTDGLLYANTESVSVLPQNASHGLPNEAPYAFTTVNLKDLKNANPKPDDFESVRSPGSDISSLISAGASDFDEHCLNIPSPVAELEDGDEELGNDVDAQAPSPGGRNYSVTDFLRNCLHDEKCNPDLVQWVNKPSGHFMIVKQAKDRLADLWAGRRGHSKRGNYSHFARNIRNCYKPGGLARVEKKKLQYRFI